MKLLLRMLEHTPLEATFGGELDRSRMLTNEAYQAKTLVHLLLLRQPNNPRLLTLYQRMTARCDRRDKTHSEIVTRFYKASETRYTPWLVCGK